VSRPRVQIDAPNQIADLRQHLEGQLPRFIAFEGVVGLTLNGGMSRGYADHLSEIDVTFYLTPEAYAAWQSGGAPIAQGITVLEGQLYDVKCVSYPTERDRTWESVALWDASYAEILYDPDGLLHAMFDEKLASRPDPCAGPVEGLLMGCWWYFELAGTIWIERGDALQGHHMLSQAVTPLVQALFVANREYIPHEKWLLHMSCSLAWVPADWERRLRAAMDTGDFTRASLVSRQAVIRALWEDVDTQIKQICCPDLPVHVMQRSTFEHLRLLANEGSMTLEAWRERTGGDVPTGDPFYPVIRVEGDRIVLDLEALLRIGPEDMYAWHYEVLRAVAALKDV
jgi:hypothetical protein